MSAKTCPGFERDPSQLLRRSPGGDFKSCSQFVRWPHPDELPSVKSTNRIKADNQHIIRNQRETDESLSQTMINSQKK